MNTGMPEPNVDISVVITIVSRIGDIRGLIEEFSQLLLRKGRTFEFILVVAEQQSSSLPLLREIQQQNPGPITILFLPKAFGGEASALAAGFDRARGEILVTSAAFFQVEIQGLETALDRIEDREVDLLVGRRYPRLGSFINRLQSRAFHWVVRLVTSTRFRDINCGFRVMRRQVAEHLNLYGDLHTFLPIIAENLGFRVEEIRLPQHEADRPTKLHGPAAFSRRFLDILTVFFLTKFTRRPLRFFGAIGLILLGSGMIITLYLGIYRILGLGGIADRPLLLLGILLMVLGVQSISIGLLGEIIIYTHSREIRDYRVVETIGPL